MRPHRWFPEDSADTQTARAEEYARAWRALRRQAWRDGLLFALEVLLSTGTGLFFMGMALHVTDVEEGGLYWQGGMLVWFVGLALALVRAQGRAERRE
ncbi:MAG TPA: hypothetical protein VEA99_08775 [Gemmatimonadaceae bacterium]|nr:hypothetical protein [Gemmatimonadaceae bacterium]